ncbi:YkgJ family cysteine cluster protein [uncultured Pseudodesulfovibrio sp.]|uniref:YkgJ family cysteine cluster protein n=1 Tax=uncultured Pseudodesulfovibrio sp. TaxID=2035858 RepID=UPI0029C7A79A|nr:YkgJ family cysteine cluster protein [uncultured Pseudodesulfovibrio sp.]
MQIQNTNEPQCRCCGKCCREGGPALHKQDMTLIQDGTIPLADIVTLRVGEWVYDQPRQEILPLTEEMLKIKGRDGTWTCLYLSPESSLCSVYDTRPAECEALFCEDTAPLQAMYGKDRLSRTDLLPEGHPLLDLMAEHDRRCSPSQMEKLAKAAREGDREAGETLKEMVVYDMEMRRLVPERSGMPAELNDFLFGRPLRVLLGAMNIKVYNTGDTVRFNFQA